MKKSLFLIVFAMLCISSFSQQREPESPAVVQKDYLKKAERLTTAGAVLFLCGLSSFVASATISDGEVIRRSCLFGPSSCTNVYRNEGLKRTFAQAGAVATLGSIPFFIAAGKMRRKVATVAFSRGQMSRPFGKNIILASVPVVQMSISL